MSEVEHSRARFPALLAANPNYFGTLKDNVLAEILPVVDAKQGDTRYEEIGCVSYSPERDLLEATILVKLSSGYNGGPCTTGSLEYVRFYVDYGAGWIDAGVGAATVNDVPEGEDCNGRPDHPHIHVVAVPLSPIRKFCATAVLPRVRAILSWQAEPTPGDPDYVPVWGEVQEDTVQIRPRRRFFPVDVLDLVAPLVKVDADLIGSLIDEQDLPVPSPEPEPLGPVALNPQPLPPQVELSPAAASPERLARIYAPEKLRALAERAIDEHVAKLAVEPVPPHRFAASEAMHALSGSLPASMIGSAFLSYKNLGIDWSSVLEILNEGKGDVSYEELECLGLDNASAQLVATFRIKRPTGFSGPPCSAGSTEYVAFWADFDDDCRLSYLGTVEVATHDYITMPASGLSYAAVLPVDLAAYRRLCEEPGIHRVRAVLSWNTPPSTTDPDAIPYWGNRLDAHVHVLPGRPYDGVARLTIVGGVATGEIDPASGLTKPVAHIAYNGLPVDSRGCPFAGRVTVHGPADPALAGTMYRLLVRDVTLGGSSNPVLTPFFVVDSGGIGSWVTPGPGGWLPWPVWSTNTLGTLGYVNSSGDDLWEVELEISGSGVVDTQRFQLDNTLNTSSLDPANAAHLAFDPSQLAQQSCGKFTAGMTITGTFDARDTHFKSWGFSLLPFALPSGALTTSVPLATSEAPVGSTWSLNTTGLQPCGYVLRLSVSDRAIVNSTWTGRSTAVDIGFCIE